MIFLARLLAGLQLLIWPLGVIGNLTGGSENLTNGLSLVPFAIPLTYLAWLAWRALKPIDLGELKFYLAHLSPGTLIALGIIPFAAPNKIFGFLLGGLAFICCGGLIIWAMHRQRKALKSQVA